MKRASQSSRYARVDLVGYRCERLLKYGDAEMNDTNEQMRGRPEEPGKLDQRPLEVKEQRQSRRTERNEHRMSSNIQEHR